jgi:diguanylate cyclase (GGDEF)-like protein/PAS domain S-box-containing protein
MSPEAGRSGLARPVDASREAAKGDKNLARGDGDGDTRFRELVDNSADMFWCYYKKPIPHFDYLSPSVENIVGYKAELFLDDFTLFLDLLDDEGRRLIHDAIAGNLPPEGKDLRFRCADGHIVIGEMKTTPVPGGLQGITRDVTELRHLQANLASLALRDPLTGLANRRLLDELLTQALARTKASGRRLSVAFLDLDHFKTINDTYGHEAGDIVLCETARRLLETVRSGDVIARLGGDEFIIVYEPDQATTDHLVARIGAAIAAPIAISATESVCCTASIGLATTVTTGYDAIGLIAAADTAMYEIKKSHKRARPA